MHEASNRLKQLDLRGLRIFLHLRRIRLGLFDQIVNAGAAVDAFLNQNHVVNNKRIDPVQLHQSHLPHFRHADIRNQADPIIILGGVDNGMDTA